MLPIFAVGCVLRTILDGAQSAPYVLSPGKEQGALNLNLFASNLIRPD